VARSRTVLAAVAAAVGLALSACSAHPGSAAVVGDESISDSRVDDVASALCAAQRGGQSGGQDLASRGARQGALDVLINSALSRQYGASQGVQPDQEQVSAALAANAQNISGLPAEHRQDFKDTLREYAEGQLMLIEVGRRELAKAGTRNATEQQAVSEGTKLRNAWAAKNAEVTVDPRFGEYSKNALLPKSGSLSVAASQSATDGGSPDPSPGWIASLPASQKCS
jgi:SurA-like N-terminal domain